MSRSSRKNPRVGALDVAAVAPVISFTAPTDTSRAWIDLNEPLSSGQAFFRQEDFYVLTSGTATLTIPTAPIAGTVRVQVIATNGTITEVTPTVVGSSVFVSGVTSGATLRLIYAYTSTLVVPKAEIDQYLAYDLPSRPDAVNLGTSSSGHAYLFDQNSIYGLRNSGEIYKSTAGNINAYDGTYLDLGLADIRIEADWSTYPGTSGQGLVGRVSDYKNKIFISNVALFVRQNEVNTQVGSPSGSGAAAAFSQTFVQGDRSALVFNGSTITVQRQAGATGAWVTVCVATGVTFNQTATRHGLKLNGTAPSSGGFRRPLWRRPVVL